VIELYDLGTIDYTQALLLQRSYHKRLIEGVKSAAERGEPDEGSIQGQVLLACSHHPVYTLGTSTLSEHLYFDRAAAEAKGISIIDVERGGSATYHGPEQAIIYPIIDLKRYRTDVGWYMRLLEEVAIRLLKEYAITGLRIAGKTGVWVDCGAPELSKIAFSGVRISRWCTMHGLSLNVLNCAERFNIINPCGLGNIGVASIEELIGRRIDPQEAREGLMRCFLELCSE
jgi:lipoyl(octanoyl) transferase